MNSFLADVRIQQSLMILLFSFTAALVIVGILLCKYRFLDNKKHSNKSSSLSKLAGTAMIMFGSILGAASFIVLVFSLIMD